MPSFFGKGSQWPHVTSIFPTALGLSASMRWIFHMYRIVCLSHNFSRQLGLLCFFCTSFHYGRKHSTTFCDFSPYKCTCGYYLVQSQNFGFPKELKKPCYREDVLTTMNSSRAETSGLWSLSEMWTQLLAAHLRVAHQGVAPCLKHRCTMSWSMANARE